MDRFRLGLRSRVTWAFAIGGLLVTVILGILTVTVTSQVLLTGRDSVAQAVVFANASRVQQQLTGDLDPAATQNVIDGLNTSAGSRPLLVTNDGEGQFSLDETFGIADLPPSLLEITNGGGSGRIRTSVQGTPAIVYGISLRNFDDVAYFEAVPLVEVEDTLNTIQFVLLGGGLVVAGIAALLGRFAAGRALSPLRDVSRAAEAIAGGRLETRLDTSGDEDLELLTTSFNEMAGGLEERIQRDARFASEVSHELRSPLMTLAASMEVLQNAKSEMPERSQTALDLLASDIERFQTLVEDLLEISRFDVGTASLQADPLLYAEFVRAAVAVSSQGTIPVEVAPDAEDVIIAGEKRRLARVVANLIDNAQKYGGGATRVQVSRTGDSVLLAIEDEGPGVPDDERFVIFDRFSRGSAGGRRGYDTGVGLGLSLVAEHVNLHNGRVWVEDRSNGSGARFVVQLPIADHLFDEHEELAS